MTTSAAPKAVLFEKITVPLENVRVPDSTGYAGLSGNTYLQFCGFELGHHHILGNHPQVPINAASRDQLVVLAFQHLPPQ